GAVAGGRVVDGDGTFPDDFAGFLIESDHGGICGAGGANQFVAVDQRRLRVVPAAAMAAEITFEVLVPCHFPRLRIDADEVAVLADGVDAVAVRAGRSSEVA